MIVVGLHNVIRLTTIADDEASRNGRKIRSATIIQDNNRALCVSGMATDTAIKLCFKTSGNRPYVGALGCHKQMDAKRTAQTANGKELVCNHRNCGLTFFITTSCIKNHRGFIQDNDDSMQVISSRPDIFLKICTASDRKLCTTAVQFAYNTVEHLLEISVIICIMARFAVFGAKVHTFIVSEVDDVAFLRQLMQNQQYQLRFTHAGGGSQKPMRQLAKIDADGNACRIDAQDNFCITIVHICICPRD